MLDMVKTWGKKTLKIIIAAGPIIVKDNKVLLAKHGDTDFFKFCGGRIDNLYENLTETAKRSAKDEMGISITITNDIPFILYDKKNSSNGYIDVVLVHYLASIKDEVKPAENIREWGWYDVNNLPKDLSSNIIPALQYFKII